ncbi:hypothetical protein KI387_036958, partial [Taxus chinensis]
FRKLLDCITVICVGVSTSNLLDGPKFEKEFESIFSSSSLQKSSKFVVPKRLISVAGVR